jgi:5'-nucleotidase/UDP-sugar diphosphatase
MNHRFLRILVLLAFLAVTPFLHSAPKVLTILHTNDTHSNLFPFGPENSLGGIARMSSLIKELRAKDQNVLALNAGDVFVGTFEFNKYWGYPELKIMEGLYDAMELGNHEFDLGTDVLTGVLSGVIPGNTPVMMPIICANIDTSKAPLSLSALVKPYLIKEIGGLKLGITGVVTTDAINYSSDVLAFLTDPYAAAGTQAAILKMAGCDIVICISHLGLMADEQGLSQVPNIDVIVGGHSHDALTSPVITPNGRIIVQAGEFGLYLGELKLNINNGSISVANYQLHPITSRVSSDPHLLQTLAMLRVGLVQDPRFGPVLSAFVARADYDMEKSWPAGTAFRDTAVGDLVADALKWGVKRAGQKVDVALEALGYIGSKIYEGKIVSDDVMRVVPYGYDRTSGLGFKIVLVQLSGLQIFKGLEFSVYYVPYINDLMMQPSGLTFAYDSTNSPGARVDYASVAINGNPVDPLATYWVAMNEQVYKVLKSLDNTVPNPVATNLFEYNLIRDYMKKLIHVGYVSQGRVIDSSVH